MMTTNPTGKPVKKTPAKKVPTKKAPASNKLGNTSLIPGMGLSKFGYESMSGKKGISIKKAKDGDLLNKVSKTKIKDVPAKAEKLGKKVIEKGKKFASDTVEKVKNTTVGDAAKAVANTTGPGIAYNLAKKFANSDIGKQIKEDLNPERLKKGLKNIKSNLGFKHGGKVSKMRNGGPVPKAQYGKLTQKELDALSHQKRGMGTLGSSYVKKRGLMNDLGHLTGAQQDQLKTYMSKAGTAKKIYEALPNVGTIFGSSAANIPKGSQLEKQRKGGAIKKKMRNGGSLSGLTASTKRDKGVDPKGAFTKVQKKTLRGAKGKASLTKDKQLGATKMKMGGRMKKC